jgi:hypothetical protein
MCIVTITLPVQCHDNEWSCVLLPLHYLYKARTISGHVYCYHYTTCTKPGQGAVICIVTITLSVQNQVNERSCVLLPLHYLYKARKISGHVYCYHYTICKCNGNNTNDRLLSRLCTGSVMVTIRMTTHCHGIVQVV